MFGRFSLAAIVPLLAAMALGPVGTACAQAFYEHPVVFTLTKDCVATTSIKKKTHPVPLDAGDHLVALGENKFPGGTHVFVQVCDQRKWLPLSCGEIVASGTGADSGGGSEDDDTAAGAECPVFFDRLDNPEPVLIGDVVDVTPPPPPLDAFDEAVMELCGAPGKRVSRQEFRDLLTAHPEVLERIESFTGRKVYDSRPVPDDREGFLDDLTDAWFEIKAFDHILCGEPEPGGLVGGLHFHGRYLQLQRMGLACRVVNADRTEVVDGVIYTMGVRMRVRNGEAFSPVKGYGLTLGAEEILKLVTRAFAENPTTSPRSTACLLAVTDDPVQGEGEISFTGVFVRRSNGIRTFYPDATPDRAGESACVAAIDLSR
jgi:hypothetical protein